MSLGKAFPFVDLRLPFAKLGLDWISSRDPFRNRYSRERPGSWVTEGQVYKRHSQGQFKHLLWIYHDRPGWFSLPRLLAVCCQALYFIPTTSPSLLPPCLGSNHRSLTFWEHAMHKPWRALLQPLTSFPLSWQYPTLQDSVPLLWKLPRSPPPSYTQPHPKLPGFEIQIPAQPPTKRAGSSVSKGQAYVNMCQFLLRLSSERFWESKAIQVLIKATPLETRDQVKNEKLSTK